MLNVSAELPLPDLAVGYPNEAPDATSGHAWRHEMELAQAQAWLGNGSPFAAPREVPSDARVLHTEGGAESRQLGNGYSARVATRQSPQETAHSGSQGAPAGEVMYSTSSPWGLIRRAVNPANIALRTDPADSFSRQQPIHAAFTLSRCDIGQSSSVESSAQEGVSDEGPAQRFGADPLPPAGEELPVRIHIEGNERASAVWIGLSSHVEADLYGLKKVIAKWLSVRGYGPARWVCNGRALTADKEDGEPHQLSVSASMAASDLESGALHELHSEFGEKP